MPDGTLLGPGALAKAVTKPYVTTYAWQTGDYCTHAGKVYKFIGEDLTQGEEWTPEHWSETKITDELNNLQDQIDNMTPETGTSMFSDISFTINTNQWTESSGIYSYNYSNALIKSTSGIQVFYDPAFRNFVGDINVAKYTGYLTFTTTRQPIGAITGTIRIIDSISGTLPVTRGGTGAVNAKGARQNLNVSIKPIPIDFGTVSSLPQTAYDDDITAEMIAVRWDIGTPSACPKGITCTAAAGSVTISLDSNQTFSGESTIKLWLVNPRTVADNGTGQNQDQYVGDYVQVGAQTLTATQKTQVLTNIGGASAASVTDLANSIGTVPSGKTVEGQITELNSKITTVTDITSSCTWGANVDTKYCKVFPAIKLMLLYAQIPAGKANYFGFCKLPSGYKFADSVIETLVTSGSQRIQYGVSANSDMAYLYTSDGNTSAVTSQVNAILFYTYWGDSNDRTRKTIKYSDLQRIYDVRRKTFSKSK